LSDVNMFYTGDSFIHDHFICIVSKILVLPF